MDVELLTSGGGGGGGLRFSTCCCSSVGGLTALGGQGEIVDLMDADGRSAFEETIDGEFRLGSVRTATAQE